jgi:GAF domain-containing protein/CheY-like chemotaxis protein
VKVALGRPFVRRAVPRLIVVVVLWLVAGTLLAGHLAARHDTAASATFASVGKVVAGVLDEVRFDASLLAQDPVVVEGTMKSDWASLGQGVWPWIVTLTQDRLADLLLIVDGSGAPLIQVPPAPGGEAPVVARPDATVARLDVIDEQPYLLGIAPMTAGMVVVGRRFDSLAGTIAGLPVRVALVMVSGDRALGSTLPDAPPLDWAGAMRSGLVTIRDEPWFARPLGETGGRIWALVSARDQRGENRQLWFWWVLSLLAAAGAAVGIAAVSPRGRGDGEPEGAPAREGDPRDSRRSRELEALHAVVVATGRGDDLALTAERTLEVVCGVAQVPFGGVFRFDRATQTLALIAHRGLLPDDVERLRVRSLDQSHVGEVIRVGRPVVTDLAASQLLTPEVAERVKAGGYRTQLALPIPVNGETWGVMALISREARTYDADELTLLQAVAHQVGQAVARAALLAESREKSRRLETLARLAQTLTATLSLDDVFHRVVDAAIELLASSTAQLWLVDDDGRHVSRRAAAGSQPSPDEVERVAVGDGLVGRVVATREPLTAVDALRDPRARNVERVRAEGVVSVGMVPLLAGERVLGALTIGVRARREYSADELRLLGSLASHAANAINNARLYREATRQAQRMSALADLARMVSETLDFDPAAQRIADSVCSLLGARSSCLYRLDLASGALVAFAASREAGPSYRWEPVLPGGTGIAGLAISQRRSVASADVLADARITYTDQARARIEQEPRCALLAVPLMVKGQVFGALAVNDRAGRVFDESEIRLAQTFADQAALALENARLYTEARRRRLEAEELARLARALTESLDPQAVGERIAESVLALFQVRSSVLRLLRPDGSLVTLARGGRRRQVSVRENDLPAGVGASGRAAAEGRAVASPDIFNDPSLVMTDEVALAMRRAGDAAVVAVPLRAKDRIIGTLSLGDTAGRVFTEAEVGLLQTFGDQAALALENARLFSLESARRGQIAVLAEAERELAPELDPGRLLTLIIERATRLFSAPGVIYLADAGGMLVPRAWTQGGGFGNLSLASGQGVVGACAEQRRGLIENDYAASRFALSKWVELGVSRAMAFPLTVQDRLLGVVAMNRAGADAAPFSDDDLALLESFAARAAIALENARLYEQNRRQVEELSVLLELSRAVTGQLDRTTLLEAIHTQVGRVLDADNMAIVLRDDERGDLEVVLRTLDGVRDMRSPLRYPSRSVGLMSVVLETGEPVRTDDYAAECARWHVEPVTTFAGVRHWLGVPMRAGDTVIGVLTVRSRERSFVQADERLLTNIAHLAALALRNAGLFEERTRAYSELAAAQDQLVRTEKLRALGEMASGVAHDFNNLLASILGRAQLTLQRLQDPQLRKWIQVIERAALDGAQTVRRLQEFTRIRRDQPFVAVDLNEVIRGALEITQSRWREETRSRGVAVDVRTSLTSVPGVGGDPAELREAMTNLILNAVDAMPEGGTLTLTTAVENSDVVVTVADSGVGIPEAIRGKIFDPFFTTKGPQGTGLGLSMTYGILSRHGARITVDSREGQGTVFRLTFPPGEAHDVEGPTPAEPAPLGVSLRCLVVDDEEQVGTVLGDILKTGGHRVVVLGDGGEAIERFRAEPFDLVFTDLAMPRVSGWQVAQAVKEIAPTVQVILVTGFGVELSAEERRAQGVDLVLVKPLRISEVLDVVARAGRRRVQRS